MATDFAKLLPNVAAELLGEPNKRLSSKDEVRYGSNGSLSVDLKKLTWFDHEAQDGGGTIDLVRVRLSVDKAGALKWLADNGWIDEKAKPNGHDHSASAAEPDRAAGPDEKRVHEAEYDYVDERGDVVLQVVRVVFTLNGEPVIDKKTGKRKKTFMQRRKPRPDDPPDRIKRGWVYSGKDVRPVPYRLPDLQEAIALGRTVYIVEGEKVADRLIDLGAAATTNAGGAGKWSPELSEFFAGADVVILPDNDAQATTKDGSLRFTDDGRPIYTGQDHAQAVAASLNGIAARVRILALGGDPVPPGPGPYLPAKGDAVDWLDAGYSIGQLYELAEQAKTWTPGQAISRLHFGSVWFESFHTSMREPDYLVRDMLTAGDLSLVFGAPSSGKSFFATDLAMAIARGADVHGKRVKQGGVIYIAAEGKTGFKNRLRAYAYHYGIELGTQLPFVLVPASVNLYAQEGDITTLLADIAVIQARMAEMGTDVALTVIDTFAAVSIGANENASEDMSKIIGNCSKIQKATAGHVMIVHHDNAAGTKPRGHSSLTGAVDNSIEVVTDDAGNRTAIVRKLKEGPDGEKIPFRLHVVEIGRREDDGSPVTSCVVEPLRAQAEPRKARQKVLNARDRVALDALVEAINTRGMAPPPSLALPGNMMVVEAKTWLAAYYRRVLTGDGDEAEQKREKDAARKNLGRAGEELLARRIVGREAPYVWIARDLRKGGDG